MNNKALSKVRLVIILLVCYLLVGGCIAFFNPISETMFCNADYLCKVEHKFMCGITKENNFHVNFNTNFDIKERTGGSPSKYSNAINYKYYIVLDNFRSIFIKPYLVKQFQYSTDSDIEQFNLYLKNPQMQYYIESSAFFADSIFLIIWTIIIFALICQVIIPQKRKTKWK